MFSKDKLVPKYFLGKCKSTSFVCIFSKHEQKAKYPSKILEIGIFAIFLSPTFTKGIEAKLNELESGIFP